MAHDRTAGGVIALSRERGFPAKLCYLMDSRPVGGMDAVFSALPAHLKYWIDLDGRGVVLAGGPVLPRDLGQAYEGVGLIVIRANSLEDAERLCAQDPMHLTGARQFVVTPWLVNHGNSL